MVVDKHPTLSARIHVNTLFLRLRFILQPSTASALNIYNSILFVHEYDVGDGCPH
jgi:hypothetical protein